MQDEINLQGARLLKMKIITKKEILPVSLILIVFAFGLSIYHCLPETMPTHWNAQGEVDGWGSRDFAVFFFPCLILGVYLLMLFIPLIDPLKKNYPLFARPYFYFRLLIVFFFASLYFYTLAAGLGLKMNINYFIIPANALLFILIGGFLPKIKKNYFVGIKTPWTFHSEEVWDKTHQFSGKLFIAAGIFSLLGLLNFWLFVIPILTAALGSIIYSYFVFRRVKGFDEELK